MFYVIFLALCKKNGVAKTKACLECGLSKSAWIRWEKGNTPNVETLQKLGIYFKVSSDFLLGTTPEAYLLWSQYSLAEAEKAYKVEKDVEKRNELANQIDSLRESIENQPLQVALLPQKDAAQKDGDMQIASYSVEKFAEDIIRIINGYVSGSPEKRRRILALAEQEDDTSVW